MRAGGVGASFNQQMNGGRIDITIARAADTTGASGTGLLAAFCSTPSRQARDVDSEWLGNGSGRHAMGLQFRPITISVQQ